MMPGNDIIAGCLPLRERPLQDHRATGSALDESLPEDPTGGQTRKLAAMNPIDVTNRGVGNTFNRNSR